MVATKSVKKRRLGAPAAEPRPKRKPSGNAGKGRRKGVPNKMTKALKEQILGALDQAGGQKYLAEQAVANPGPFMALLGKVLPTTLAGDSTQPIRHIFEWLSEQPSDES